MVKTYMSATLEDDAIRARAFAVGKCANGLGGFVLEANKHFMQIIRTKFF
jgi:hypothetical protein